MNPKEYPYALFKVRYLVQAFIAAVLLSGVTVIGILLIPLCKDGFLICLVKIPENFIVLTIGFTYTIYFTLALSIWNPFKSAENQNLGVSRRAISPLANALCHAILGANVTMLYLFSTPLCRIVPAHNQSGLQMSIFGAFDFVGCYASLILWYPIAYSVWFILIYIVLKVVYNGSSKDVNEHCTQR